MNRQALRIAVLLPTLNAGGAERAMINLARGLSELDFSVDLVLVTAKGVLLAEVPDTVRLVDLGQQRVAKSLPALVRYLRRERPDAMVSGLDFVNILAICACRLARVGTRLVVTQRTMLSRRVDFANSRISRIIPGLTRWFYPWAHRIVGVSRGVADDMVNKMGIPANMVDVIYNPISSRRILDLAEQSIEHPWFQDSSPTVVLAVGRLVRIKDFAMLIRAFSLVRVKQDARLIVLGEGEERANLEALIQELGLEDRVSLPGFVANPYPYMKRAAVFVLSSQVEGLPGALLEAMTCGTPVIATDCPSGPREILQDGKLGLLVPVGDCNAMAKAIDSVLSREEHPTHESCLEAFDPDVVLTQYVNVLFPDLKIEPVRAT